MVTLDHHRHAADRRSLLDLELLQHPAVENVLVCDALDGDADLARGPLSFGIRRRHVFFTFFLVCWGIS